MSSHRAKQGLYEINSAAESDVTADAETPIDMGLASPGAPELVHHGESAESTEILYQIG